MTGGIWQGDPDTVLSVSPINFVYDNAFRITGITDTGTSANSWTLGYDALDRLNTASNTGSSYGWTYDANGNRLTQTGTSGSTFTPSSTSNQLNSTTGALARTYLYDAAGNTKSYSNLTFTYNQRGRPSAVTVGHTTTDYFYNVLGQMIKKTVGSTTTLLMYDEAGHLLGEYSSSGALNQETVWMGDIPVATLRPNGSTISIYYVHADQLNAPRKITRPSDNGLMWRWDADPFGTVAPNQNPSKLGTFIYNLRFPGQYYQAETGLNYNNFRDYDPATGRYIESDPIGLKGGVNLYAYVKSDPTMLTDPFGLQSNADSPVDKAIELYKKVCKKEDETCQQYFERIYKMCVSGPFFMNGPACKVIAGTVNQPCIEGDAQSITCKKPFACTDTTSSSPPS